MSEYANSFCDQFEMQREAVMGVKIGKISIKHLSLGWRTLKVSSFTEPEQRRMEKINLDLDSADLSDRIETCLSLAQLI